MLRKVVAVNTVCSGAWVVAYRMLVLARIVGMEFWKSGVSLGGETWVVGRWDREGMWVSIFECVQEIAAFLYSGVWLGLSARGFMGLRRAECSRGTVY